jgi:hypothetical protein
MLKSQLLLFIYVLYIQRTSSFAKRGVSLTQASKLTTISTRRYVQQIQKGIKSGRTGTFGDQRRHEIGELELNIRKSISKRSWSNTTEMLQGLNTTRLSSGRDVVYVITETSRRARNVGAILPLLTSLPLKKLDYTTEDDVIPTLVECCSRTNRLDVASKIVSLLRKRGVHFSAKTYSILISGYGRVRGENAINRILKECMESSVEADVILLNSVMDAYIRYVRTQT